MASSHSTTTTAGSAAQSAPVNTSGTGTTAPGASSAGTQESAGNAIKSAYNVVHGGLDKLRGEAMAVADGAGNAVSNRKEGEVDQRSELSSREIAAQGESEFNQGLAAFSKK